MAKVTAAGGTTWILSRGVDLTLIIGAPLLSVALLLPLAQVVSSSSIWVAVMAFGAVGHHLPGFLRTYGDRELFRRYRLRFLVAPPLVFAATLVFSLRDLHGVALIAMVWSAWHGMMQHYGFLRIYDAKERAASPYDPRLDLAMTVSWFATCLLFSPNMGGSIIDALQSTRFALPSPRSLDALRWVSLVATVATTAIYIVVTLRAIQRGQRVSWHKLALLTTTTALVWFARVVTTDPFLSVALFEVLHDVQYLAIVWAFNRRLVATGHDRTRLARTLFSPGAFSLGAYVGVCMAYGAVAFATYTVLPEGTGKTVLVSLLLTSGILHYYYDGFIWKLRRSETREGLALENRPARARTVMAPAGDSRAVVHLGAFAVGVAALAAVENGRPSQDPIAAAQAVVALVPGSPTSQTNAGTALLESGRVQDALPHLREAARLMPTADSRTRLGAALLASGLVDESIRELEGARQLDPDSGGASLALANARMKRRDFGAAVRDYREAIRLGAGGAAVQASLGQALIEDGQIDEAERELRAALALDPALVGAHMNLGLILDRTGRVADAEEHFLSSVRLRPDLAAAHNNLGIVLVKLGRPAEAVERFRSALQIDPGYESARRSLAALSGQ